MKSGRGAMAFSLLSFSAFAIFSSIAIAANNGVDFHGFRNILLGALDEAYTQEQMNYLIYAPTPDLLSSPRANDANGFLAALVERFKREKPSDLYQAGKELPIRPVESVDDILARQEITLVIVPGIFGEFIDTRAFEDIFKDQKDSLYYQTFQSRLHRLRNHPELITDHHFTTKAMAQVSVPLDSLVHVVSEDTLDERDGKKKPLLRLVLFHTPRMSLETLGHQEKKAANFLRRFTKFMHVMGEEAPKNIVLVGYSQGLITGLDMLVQAKRINDVFLSRVRGMVSLGGVTFGSDLADEAQREGSVTNRQLTLLKILADNLQTLEPFEKENEDDSAAQRLQKARNNARIFASNTKRFVENTAEWLKFGRGFALLPQDPNFVTTMLNTILGIEPSVERDGGLMGAAQRAKQVGQFVKSMQKEFGLFFEDFGIKEMKDLGSEYSMNIRRFSLLVKEVLTGVNGLTTQARFAWWSDPNNLLPTRGIRYYTVAATMMDQKWEPAFDFVAKNTVCFAPDSIDYQLLRQNTEDFRKASGISVNDSQVAIHKVHFWPEWAALLNPYYAQNRLDSTFLGVLGTHHWGLALRVVNKIRGLTNPFPRVALARALGAAVALDIQSGSLK